MTIAELKKTVQDLIANARTRQSMEAIKQWALDNNDTEVNGEIVTLLGRLTALERQERIGLITNSEADVNRVKLGSSVLNLINAINLNSSEKSQSIPNQEKKTILFITSSPNNMSMPNVGRQQRAIMETINEKRQENFYELKMIGFVLPEDLIDEIENQNPDIIHFFMHNDKESGLYFENGNGEEIPIDPEDLALIFREITRRKKIECTVLNACNSAMHVSAISAYVPNIVYTNDFVPDSVGAGNNDTIASLFTRKFYEHVFLNRTYQEAVERANIALRFSKMPLSKQNTKKIEEIFSIQVNQIS